MNSKIINLFIYLLIFSLSLGQLGKYSIGGGVNLYIHDLFIIILLLLSIPKKINKTPKLLKPIFAFAFVAFVSLVISLTALPFSAVAISSLYLWRWLAYAGVYFIVIQVKPTQIKQALIASGFLAAVLGLIQYILLPDTRFLFTQFFDDHYYRLIGTYLDPNFAGIMLVLTLLLTIVYSKNSFSRYLLQIICFIALLFTYSRSSYLGLLVGLLAISLFKKNAKYIIIGTLLLIFSLPLLPRPGGEGVNLMRTQSTIARVSSTQQTLQLVKQKPILGSGFNTLRFIRNDFTSRAAAGADNSFIFLIATTGIVGLLVYLWLLMKMFSINQIVLITPLLLAVIVHAQFNNTLFYAPVMIWLWLIMASK